MQCKLYYKKPEFKIFSSFLLWLTMRKHECILQRASCGIMMSECDTKEIIIIFPSLRSVFTKNIKMCTNAVFQLMHFFLSCFLQIRKKRLIIFSPFLFRLNFFIFYEWFCPRWFFKHIPFLVDANTVCSQKFYCLCDGIVSCDKYANRNLFTTFFRNVFFSLFGFHSLVI